MEACLPYVKGFEGSCKYNFLQDAETQNKTSGVMIYIFFFAHFVILEYQNHLKQIFYFLSQLMYYPKKIFLRKTLT